MAQSTNGNITMGEALKIPGLLFSAALTMGANAFSAESFELKTNFQVLKCIEKVEPRGSSTSCEAIVVGVGTPTTIDLTNCSAGTHEVCNGTWSETIVKDGQEFKAVIMVTKFSEITSGKTDYSLAFSASAPGLPVSYVTLYLKGKSLTDQVQYSSPRLSVPGSSSDESLHYQALLSLNP